MNEKYTHDQEYIERIIQQKYQEKCSIANEMAEILRARKVKKIKGVSDTELDKILRTILEDRGILWFNEEDKNEIIGLVQHYIQND